MPPLRQTMCFVDSDQRERHVAQTLQCIRSEQGFRRDIEQIKRPSMDITPQGQPVIASKVGIERRSLHTCLPERGDLIGHQRQKR